MGQNISCWGNLSWIKRVPIIECYAEEIKEGYLQTICRENSWVDGKHFLEDIFKLIFIYLSFDRFVANGLGWKWFWIVVRLTDVLNGYLEPFEQITSVFERCFFFVCFKLSGQQIPWGRDRHKHFRNSWACNFVSFKGIFLKSIQATILDSRNIVD